MERPLQPATSVEPPEHAVPGPSVAVLLVEDDPAQQELLKIHLCTAGFAVEAVANARDAVERLQRGGIGVALVDLRLPDSSGTELLEMLSDAAPRTKLIVLTGYATLDTAMRAVRLRLFGYLEKDVAPRTIVAETQRAASAYLGEELARSTRRLDVLLDQSPDLIMWISEDGRIAAVNRAFGETSREQALGAPVLDYFRSTSRESVRDALEEVAATRERRIVLCHGLMTQDEHLWLECHLGPVSPEDGGGVLLIARDVTTRQNQEIALQNRTERLSLVLDTLPAVIWTTDRALRITSSGGSGLVDYVHHLASELKTTLPESVAGQPIEETAVRHHELAVEGHASEYEGLTPGKEIRAFVRPLTEIDGSISGVVGLAIDVTESRLAERRLAEQEQRLAELQKLDAIGRLASGVAHDFNNLLIAIAGDLESAQLMIERDRATSALAVLHRCSEAVNQAKSLTESLLTFARGESVPLHPLDLCRLIRSAAPALSSGMPAGVQLSIDAPGEAWIRGNDVQLRQIVFNLVQNARDAVGQTGRIGVSVTHEMAPLELDGDPVPGVSLRVSDDGIGMPPEVAARVHEPYFSTKPRGQGTGLGLAIVGRVVSSHGGSLGIDSVEDEGTTMHVFIPSLRDPEHVDPDQSEWESP